MIVKKITLENFRGYVNNTLILDNLTVIIGKNDVGKSTWLDALEIFFEEGKPELMDANINADGKFSITVSFLPPESLIIDATNPIDLTEEALLDEDGLITVKRTFKNGKIYKSYIVANHYSGEKMNDLLLLKLDKLEERSNELGITNIEGDRRKAATWRRAIRDRVGKKDDKVLQEISIDEDEGKEIWDAIKNQFPIYGLFRVDRNNQDQDEEAQDPFKVAIKEILTREQVVKAISELKDLVKEAYLEIADNTIIELNKINSNLAKKLRPDFGEPNFATAFKPFIDTDNGVPLNKRGSGVRRMVLLSFFKAEVERRKKEKKLTSAIFAVEEPETSQHPIHQDILVKALDALSKDDNTQVIITTHSPQLVKQIDYKKMRLIRLEEDNITRTIESGDNILIGAKDELGELPKISEGYLICVEGENDVKFLKGISECIPELQSIINLLNVPIFPLRGGFAEKWATERYLRSAQINEFHMYDRDCDSKYKDIADEVNSWPKCKAILTSLREMENYVNPRLLNMEFGTTLSIGSNWGEVDVPFECNKVSKKGEPIVKQIINGKLSKQCTKELLQEIGVFEEVKGWFENIKKFTEQ